MFVRGRSKTSEKDQKRKDPISLRPGECISVDMVMSCNPGFIAQMTGKLVASRYTRATVYVESATNLDYFLLQRSDSEVETLKGKMEFEDYSRSIGEYTTGYHADSSTFWANPWQES